MPARFDGKVVLVSGAGGTKGLALAQLLASAGAKIYLTDVNDARIANVAEQTEHPQNVHHSKLDAGVKADWIETVDHIKEAEGRLDILINSARLFGVGQVADISIDEWRRCAAANLDGTFLGAKTVLPLMSRAAAAAS